VTYISNHRPPYIDHTSKIKEKHVTNKLSKFKLNPTVNEPENLILQKNTRIAT